MDRDARCEPAPELREKDGWHWVEAPVGEPLIARWHPAERSDLEPLWTSTHHVYSGTPRYAVREWGWRYLSPVLTPAEAAALRAERDAAVAEGQKYLSAAATARTDLWLMTEQRDGFRDGCDRLKSELTTLRAENARLREALKYLRAYPNAIAAQTNADAALAPKP